MIGMMINFFVNNMMMQNERYSCDEKDDCPENLFIERECRSPPPRSTYSAAITHCRYACLIFVLSQLPGCVRFSQIALRYGACMRYWRYESVSFCCGDAFDLDGFQLGEWCDNLLTVISKALK